MGVQVDVRYCGRVGVRRMVNDIKDELLSAPTERRAWILQETTLAPAVLYFGTDSLYWHCLQSSASESFPGKAPERTSLWSSRTPTHLWFEGDPATAPFLMWYNFIREYTWRNLTYHTDRLIAIEGLAQRFSQATKSRYEYGLLISGLHRGLLWHRGAARTMNLMFHNSDFEYEINYLTDTTRFEEYYAPSWSWGSLIGGLQYDWGELDTPFNNQIDFEYQASFLVNTDHPPDRLCLEGFLVEGYCRLKRYHEELVVVFRRGTEPPGTDLQLSCIIDLDEDVNTKGCYLLPISAWSAKFLDTAVKSSVAFYLILVKDEAASTQTGLQCRAARAAYRRIGMGGDYIDKLRKLMSGSEKQTLHIV